MRSNLVDIDVEVLSETDKAWRVTDGKVTVWVPKSHAEVEYGGHKGHGWITMPEWLAKEKDLV